jgi:DOMON domain
MKVHQISLALALAIAPIDAGSYPSYYSWNKPASSPTCPPPAPRPAPAAIAATLSPTASPTTSSTNVPTEPPTLPSTSQPTPREPPAAVAPPPPSREPDCSLASADPIQLEDNLEMRQVVNQDDNSVTVQLVLQSEAWVGFAFSPSGQMVPNTAVIGLPGTGGGVGLYSLSARAVEGVTLLPEDQQDRLSDVSIEQEDGETTLTFTYRAADGEALATGGEASRIIYAYGSSNTLGFHAFRSSAEIVFDNCLEVSG